jgi:hypothetical protein
MTHAIVFALFALAMLGIVIATYHASRRSAAHAAGDPSRLATCRG